MALRLAGEEFSVVQGLDGQGWPRQVQANDADPGLRIDQSGSGPALRFQQAAIIDTVTGDLSLNPAGDIAIGGKKIKSTNLLIKEESSTTFAVRNAADSSYQRMKMLLLTLTDTLDFGTPTANLEALNADNSLIRFRGRDNGVGMVEIARLQGAADPYFQATLPMVLNPASQPGTVVEGHFWYDSTAKKLKFYNGTAVETVTSA